MAGPSSSKRAAAIATTLHTVCPIIMLEIRNGRTRTLIRNAMSLIDREIHAVVCRSFSRRLEFVADDMPQFQSEILPCIKTADQRFPALKSLTINASSIPMLRSVLLAAARYSNILATVRILRLDVGNNAHVGDVLQNVPVDAFNKIQDNSVLRVFEVNGKPFSETICRIVMSSDHFVKHVMHPAPSIARQVCTIIATSQRFSITRCITQPSVSSSIKEVSIGWKAINDSMLRQSLPNLRSLEVMTDLMDHSTHTSHQQACESNKALLRNRCTSSVASKAGLGIMYEDAKKIRAIHGVVFNPSDVRNVREFEANVIRSCTSLEVIGFSPCVELLSIPRPLQDSARMQTSLTMLCIRLCVVPNMGAKYIRPLNKLRALQTLILNMSCAHYTSTEGLQLLHEREQWGNVQKSRRQQQQQQQQQYRFDHLKNVQITVLEARFYPTLTVCQNNIASLVKAVDAPHLESVFVSPPELFIPTSSTSDGSAALPPAAALPHMTSRSKEAFRGLQMPRMIYLPLAIALGIARVDARLLDHPTNTRVCFHDANDRESAAHKLVQVLEERADQLWDGISLCVKDTEDHADVKRAVDVFGKHIAILELVHDGPLSEFWTAADCADLMAKAPNMVVVNRQ